MAPTLMDATSIVIPWLELGRHDEGATPEDTGDTDTTSTHDTGTTDTAEVQDPTTEADTDAKPDDGLGDAGKKAIAEIRAERNRARKEAADAKKAAAELARKVAEYEERDKTEVEKLAAKADKAESRAKVATERAVKAEIKAVASATFLDPTDAETIGDLSAYVSDDGDIDVDQIKADLEDLLERKPHWRKPEPAPDSGPSPRRAKPAPKPDPGQGPRQEPGPPDFRTADQATVDAELARLGIRPRR